MTQVVVAVATVLGPAADALAAENVGAARAAVAAHLDFVETALAEQVKAEGHEAVARQRLERLGER